MTLDQAKQLINKYVAKKEQKYGSMAYPIISAELETYLAILLSENNKEFVIKKLSE